MALEQTKENITEYVRGKAWYWYLPVWLFGLYLFTQLLDFGFGKELPFFISIAYGADFMLHELAHIFTGFLPGIITAAAGSISELILGAGLIIGAFLTRSYFASLFCFLWAMLACYSAGSYMADASTQTIPLVSLGGGDNAVHDWNYVFTELNLLSYDTFIGGTLKVTGAVIGLFGLGFTAWLIYKMASAKEHSALTEKEAAHIHETAAKISPYNTPPTEHYSSLQGGSIYPTASKGRLAETGQPKVKVKNNN